MYNYSIMGKYGCKHLPMGVSNPPVIFQQKMNISPQGFEFILVYIGVSLILEKFDWKDHIQKLKLTLNKL